MGDRIDVRRGHEAAPNTSSRPFGGNIIDAEVVGNDQHDVGRPLTGQSDVPTLLPVHWPVRRDAMSEPVGSDHDLHWPQLPGCPSRDEREEQYDD